MAHDAHARSAVAVPDPVDDLDLVWSSCLLTLAGVGLIVAILAWDAGHAPPVERSTAHAPQGPESGGAGSATHDDRAAADDWRTVEIPIGF